MVEKTWLAAALVAAVGAPGMAAAQTADLGEIRQQIRELKESYEARIRALEEKLKAAEEAGRRAGEAAAQASATAQRAEQAAASATASGAQPQVPQTQPQQNAFNPTISLILNGTWGRYGNDPGNRISGFAASDLGEAVPRGGSLGESELFLAANIDPNFRGALLAALTPENTVEVEEAFVETLALGHGFTLKGGRFFSGIGYHNAVHAHAWDFTDASLVQRAFLGNNYGDDGVQLRYVAPLPVLVEIGAELGRGREFPGSATGFERNRNGQEAGALFAHLGGDIGDSHSYQAGVSYLRGRAPAAGVAILDLDDMSGVANLFTGRQRVTGVDFVYKWAPDGNPAYRNFKFVTEWFQRKLDGRLTFDDGGAGQLTDTAEIRQSGWYAQGVYQFHPYWRVGTRYDRLSRGSAALNANAANLALPDFDPQRVSVMVDFNPSEFSRIRLQYNRDRLLQDAATGQAIPDNVVFLQYVMSLGAHGAHRF